jgi:endonuclease-3
MATNKRTIIQQGMKKRNTIISGVVNGQQQNETDMISSTRNKRIRTTTSTTSSSTSSSNKLVSSNNTSIKFTPPPDWNDTYRVLKRIRSEFIAPVDEFGPHKLFDSKQSIDSQRYQILTALMLSSQTKDQITAQAMTRLNELGITSSPKSMKAIQPTELEKLIYPVGFYRRKTISLIETATILDRDYAGKVPHDYDALINLPGVGPKMAHLALHHAFDDVRGIGVDTHVHRITNVLHWAKSDDAEKTRAQLESWFPQEEWKHINYILVGIGQSIQQPTYCTRLIEAIKKWPENEDKILINKVLKRLGLK